MASITDRPGQMPTDEASIAKFLYEEAALIDEGHLAEWLALMEDDIEYWLPAMGDGGEAKKSVSLIYDNKTQLEDRVWRLLSGLAHTTDPAAKIQHFISNVTVEEAGENEVTVRSSLVLFALRRGAQTTYAGRCTHHLRWQNGGWRIASKKVVLLNNSEPIDFLQFMI